MFLLSQSNYIPLPIPPVLRNSNSNYIASLSELVRWLGRRAEDAGVEIYPGFSGAEIVYGENEGGNEGKVVGVATNDVGIDRNGHQKVKITF